MSNWLGDSLVKLSKAAESAAAAAAAAKAGAEAKLTATLNPEGESTATSQTKSDQAGTSFESECNFQNLSRNELENLCVQRSAKLQQALNKFRNLYVEHKRVQRDYEVLQEIVREEAQKKAQQEGASNAGLTDGQSSDASQPLSQIRRELKKARDENARLRAALSSQGEEQQQVSPDSSGAQQAEAEIFTLREKVKHLEDELARLRRQGEEGDERSRLLEAENRWKEEHKMVEELQSRVQELSCGDVTRVRELQNQLNEKDEQLKRFKEEAKKMIEKVKQERENHERQKSQLEARVAALEAPSGGGSGSWCHGDAHALEVAEGLARGLEAAESLEGMLEQLAKANSCQVTQKDQEIVKIRTHAKAVVENAKTKANEMKQKMTAKIEELRLQLQQQEGSSSSSSQQVKALQIQLASRESEIEAMGGKLCQLELAMTEKKALMEERDRRSEDLLAQLEQVTEQQQTLLQQKFDLEEKVQGMREECERLQGELRLLEERNKKLEQAKSEAMEQMKEEREAERRKLEELKAEQIKSLKENTKKLIEAARNKAKEADRQRSAALEELEALKLSLAEKSCAPDEHDRETEATVSVRTSEYEEKMKRKEEEIERKEEEIHELVSRVEELEEEATRLKERLSDREGSIASLRAELHGALEKIDEEEKETWKSNCRIRELNSMVEELSTASERMKVCEENLKAKLAEKEQRLKEALASASASAEMQAEVERSRSELEKSSRAARESQELNVQLQEEAEELKSRLAQLERNWAAEESARAEHESLAAKMEELEKELSDKDCDLQHAREELDGCLAELQRAREGAARMDREVEDLRADLLRERSSLAELHEAATRKGDEEAEKDGKLHGLQAKISKLTADLSEEREKARRFEENAMKLAERVAEVQETCQRQLDERELKIAELNEARARLYGEREKVKEELQDTARELKRVKSLVPVSILYKRALQAVLECMSCAIMEGRGGELKREEEAKLRDLFESGLSCLDDESQASDNLADCDGEDACEVLEGVQQLVLDKVRGVGARVSHLDKQLGELRAQSKQVTAEKKQLQERLMSKQNEIVQLLASLQQLEEQNKKQAAALPDLATSRVLRRIWSNGVAWALLEDSARDLRWVTESSIRQALEEGGEGTRDPLAEPLVPIVLEDVGSQESKFEELTLKYKAKEKQLESLQEEFRQYKIKAHTVLRQRPNALRDEEEEKRRLTEEERLRNELESLRKEKQTLSQQVKLGSENSERLELAVKQLERELGEAKANGSTLESKMKELEEEVEVWKRRLPVQERKEAEAAEEEDLSEQLARIQMDFKIEKSSLLKQAEEEKTQMQQEFELHKQKAREMLMEKDAMISKLRGRLQGKGEQGLPDDASPVRGPAQEELPEGEEKTEREEEAGGSGWDQEKEEEEQGRRDIALNRNQSEAPREELTEEEAAMLPPLSLDENKYKRRTSEILREGEEGGREMFPRSATSQEEQILEMALVQAKRDEYVTKLNERISMLKENVAESRRVQDLLCKERDHLREQNEILRKEAATLHRVEKFESKFREGINIEYLKNVLIKYVETQDHEGLIPVFYSVLEFNAEERRRLENVRVKMSSPWSKLSRGKLF